MVKTVFFLLNQQMCRLEDIKVNEQPLTELLADSKQDLESFLSNLDSFSVGGMHKNLVTSPEKSSKERIDQIVSQDLQTNRLTFVLMS